MDKLLTVVIPAYNVEKYIERCLDSFINEELLTLIEIIVVDDGGTDKTLDIAKKYASKYKDVIIPVHKENGGHGSVINYGIVHAKGKYFKVVDGDDWIDSKELLEVLKKIKDQEIDVIFSDYIKEYKYNNSQKRFSLKTSFENGKICLLSDIDYDMNMRIEIHSLIYKTDMLRKRNIKLLEKTFYEDTEYVLYPLSDDIKVIYLEHPIYHYFIGRPEQSVSNVSVLKHLNDQYRVIDSILTYYEKKDIKNKAESIKSIWQSRLFSTIKYRYTVLINEYKKVEKDLITFDEYLKNKNIEIYNILGEENYYIKWIRKNQLNLIGIGKILMKIEEKMVKLRRNR